MLRPSIYLIYDSTFVIHMKHFTYGALSLIMLVFIISTTQAQVGIGLATNGDFYLRYVNPENPADSGALRSSGNALLNGGLGPKIWIGDKRFSISLEAQAVFAATAFNVSEYKGLGAVAFPMMARLNFNGLSGLSSNDFSGGFSLGAGVQYNRTELYGVSNRFPDVTRELFPTYVTELQIGGGGRGVSFYLYGRYGIGFTPEWANTGARSLNIGIGTSFNITQMKRADKATDLLNDDPYSSEEAVPTIPNGLRL